ncbi:MAG TPA: response regulator [bacterium]|nr:response regulator [bacterium]HNB56701.1 response regulator [bacterium]HNI10676.1 response regulator [bacterium]HNM14958.1 response regulator [bacterium]HNO11616.1 response regulator [bacterium]
MKEGYLMIPSVKLNREVFDNMKLCNRKTVLVVEDEPGIRFVTSEFLKMSNFQVVTAENGQEAMKIIVDNKIDVVVTDIMMPKVNGLELLKFVRRLKGESFPVVVVSGSDLESLHVIESEHTRTLRKPYGLDRLAKEILSISQN